MEDDAVSTDPYMQPEESAREESARDDAQQAHDGNTSATPEPSSLAFMEPF